MSTSYVGGAKMEGYYTYSTECFLFLRVRTASNSSIEAGFERSVDIILSLVSNTTTPSTHTVVSIGSSASSIPSSSFAPQSGNRK